MHGKEPAFQTTVNRFASPGTKHAFTEECARAPTFATVWVTAVGVGRLHRRPPAHPFVRTMPQHSRRQKSSANGDHQEIVQAIDVGQTEENPCGQIGDQADLRRCYQIAEPHRSSLAFRGLNDRRCTKSREGDQHEEDLQARTFRRGMVIASVLPGLNRALRRGLG